jgi:hypothetical protein
MGISRSEAGELEDDHQVVEHPEPDRRDQQHADEQQPVERVVKTRRDVEGEPRFGGAFSFAGPPWRELCLQ